MRRLSSPPSPALRLFLLAACVLSSSVVAAAPFLLRGDATATAAVMEREKQWFGQEQQQQEWPQNVTQYRGEYRGWVGKEGRDGRRDGGALLSS